MGKKDDGECFPWKMKEQMLWAWLNSLQQHYLTEVWDRGGRRGGLLQKQRLIVYWIENTRANVLLLLLIDVNALEDDVVPKLSFDGRVYVCTNVWNGSIRERTINQSVSQLSVGYLLLLKSVRDVVVCWANGEVLVAFLAHFDININRPNRGGIAATSCLAGWRWSTRITDNFIVIFIVPIQIPRID